MTTTAPTLFQFRTHNIRVVTLEGQPWFVATDVCRALGLSAAGAGVARHLGNLGPGERKYVPSSNVTRSAVSWPNRGLTVITESGLYPGSVWVYAVYRRVTFFGIPLGWSRVSVADDLDTAREKAKALSELPEYY